MSIKHGIRISLKAVEDYIGLADRMYPDFSEKIVGTSLFDVFRQTFDGGWDDGYFIAWKEAEKKSLLADQEYLRDTLERMDAPYGCECDAENAAACTCFAIDKGGNPIRLDEVKPEDAVNQYPPCVLHRLEEKAKEDAIGNVEADIRSKTFNDPDYDATFARYIGVSSDWVPVFQDYFGTIGVINVDASVDVDGSRRLVCIEDGWGVWFPCDFIEDDDEDVEDFEDDTQSSGFIRIGYKKIHKGSVPILTMLGAFDTAIYEGKDWPEELPALILQPDCSLTLSGFDGDVPVLTADEWVCGFKGSDNLATDKLVCMMQKLAQAAGGIVPPEEMLDDMCKVLPQEAHPDDETRGKLLAAATLPQKSPEIALQSLMRATNEHEFEDFNTDCVLGLYRMFVGLSFGLDGWEHCVYQMIELIDVPPKILFDWVGLSKLEKDRLNEVIRDALDETGRSRAWSKEVE